MAPYPKITTYPPLGQLTIIPSTQEYISFVLVVEWNHARPSYPFEMSLAFTSARLNKHQSQWNTLPLTPLSEGVLQRLDAEDAQCATYTRRLSRQDFKSRSAESVTIGQCLFTIRFRVDAQAPWQWISVLDGTAPGELVFQQPLDLSADDTSSLAFVNLAPDWNVAAVEEANGVALKTVSYILESKDKIQNTGDSTLSTLPLATITSSVRYFSIVRLEPYWLGPRHGTGSFFHVEEDAIVSSFLLGNGLILTFVVLGWVDDVYQVLTNDEQGRIVVAAQNDSGQDRHYQVVLSIGHDFQDTMRSAMDQIRMIVTSSTGITRLSTTVKGITSSLDLAAVKASSEEWIDSLAFCTWNALGQDLTHTKLLNALEQLQKNDIHISTLLIDDNWQTLGATKAESNDPFYMGWADMQANTTVAPTGLKNLITDIRSRYPAVKDIGVWHALMGYWGGISPTGPIAQQYATTDVDALLMGNKPAVVTTVAPDALHQFYDDFYAFLRSVGLTFVKTDVQHMLSMYQTTTARKALISTYQSAWTSAHIKHFGGKAISCMSQIPQALFHSLLQTTTPAVVHRNSDDFYPEVAASHPWHVWVNAHNAHFTRHLNVVPDWDMFQTDHEFSAYHAAARCVSGGPILITDIPGQHDVKLLEEMTARAPGGSAIALRTRAGAANGVFALYTEGSMLKVAAGTDSGRGTLMAIFNVSEKAIRAIIHADEFEWAAGTPDEVLVRGHRTGEIFGPTALGGVAKSKEEGMDEAMKRLIHVRLDVRGWDILTAQPVHRVKTNTGTPLKVCVLGLLGKMSGAAAITSSSVTIGNQKVHVRVGLKALGRLGVWFGSIAASDKVEVYVQGSRVPDGILKLLVLPQPQVRGGSEGGAIIRGDETATPAASVSELPHIWEVDVEAFWKQQAMWDERCKEVIVAFVIG